MRSMPPQAGDWQAVRPEGTEAGKNSRMHEGENFANYCPEKDVEVRFTLRFSWQHIQTGTSRSTPTFANLQGSTLSEYIKMVP